MSAITGNDRQNPSFHTHHVPYSAKGDRAVLSGGAGLPPFTSSPCSLPVSSATGGTRLFRCRFPLSSSQPVLRKNSSRHDASLPVGHRRPAGCRDFHVARSGPFPSMTLSPLGFTAGAYRQARVRGRMKSVLTNLALLFVPQPSHYCFPSCYPSFFRCKVSMQTGTAEGLGQWRGFTNLPLSVLRFCRLRRQK